MAVKTCDEVINGQSYAEGTGTGKQVTRDSDVGGNGGSGDILDAIIANADFIDANATALYQYDCSEHLIEWMYKVCPALKTAGQAIDRITNKLNSITTGVKLGDLVQNNSVTQKICDVIATLFGSVNAWLEMLTKAAFALFDKIDTARERMQSALQAMTDAVLKCILDVYDMIEKYLGMLLRVSLNFDWEAFEVFLSECPCICRFIAFITGCDKDADGNNISDQADMVVLCIRDKFWFIDGLNLGTGLAAIMDDYIRQYIVLMFDAIDLAIESIFTLFIAPFRTLIKAYADLLRTKLDVTFLVAPLKVSHLDCLLLYTREVVNGKTVYKMSVLDMMESMKMWVNCLEYPCKALSVRIKNKVKQFNEDFRLNGEYWNRAYEADIYLCCMRADAAASSGYTLKELADMWDDLYDRLRTCNSRARNKVSIAKVTYGLNGTGGIEWDTYRFRRGQTEETLEANDRVAMAAQFTDSPDRENDINVGSYPLTAQEDESIRALGLSVAAGCEEDPYFVEKWYQYLRFAGLYTLSNNTVEALRDVRENASGLTGDFSGSQTTFPTSKIREPVEVDETERTPNYWVEPDYDAERVAAIEGIAWKPKRDNESLADYYGRMYATAG